MAWKTDQPPINYLKRRILYYKKKRGWVRGLKTSKMLISKYGQERTLELVSIRVKQIEARIKQYEKAIINLGGKL